MKIRNKVKQICIVVFLLVFFAIFISGTGVKVLAQDYYHNAYDYVSTYGNSCRFDVVDGEGRIYFGTSAKKAASSSTRYRTIGWKANLYLNGGYQESVYFSLNGNYINLTSTVTNGGKEYNLYYISIDSLKNRFNNQDAINSGKGEVKLDAVMSVVNPNQASPNGSMDDSGNYNGEVYDTRDGIANARGWSDKSDFDSYFNKTPVGMYRTVTVTGSTGISGTSGSGKYIYGSFATISATCSNGYEFDKWSDTSKRGIRFGVVVTSDLSYTAYAKAKTYTISYKANGGTGAPDNQTKVHGKELTLSSTKPTRTGYIFDYWTGSNGKNYNPGGTFGANADTIMTAHWTPITYYVAYNKNKPSNASHDVAGTMTNSKHAYDNGIEGNGYTTALTANAYTLKGWSFKNWNTKSDNTGTKYFNGASINNLTSTNKATVNMYAHWVPNVYMLICDDKGATTSGTPYFFERYDHGWYSDKDVKNAISTITVPKKIGYKFNGYKSGSGTLYVNASGQIVAANNSFATDGAYVYAQWIPNIYDITLNNQGAYDAGTAHIYEKYSTGFYSDSAASKVFANGKITIPKKYNYTFDGYWTQQNTYKTSRGEQIIKPDGTINNVNTKFTANTTLYAKWIPKDYKINLDNQGADVNNGTSAFHEKYGEFNYTGGISYNAGTGISTIKFNYTGSTQYFVAPADGEYTLKVAGASGASVGATGGKGGTSTGKIQLKKGDTLRIVVGGAGTKYSGGYNMGGNYDNNGIESHFGGGGATDIRLNSSSVDKRIIVAGGGGGTAYYSHIDLYANGGDGGGTVGGRLSAVYIGVSSTITPDSAVYNGSFYKYTSKLNSCGASQTSSYTFKKGEGENYVLGKPDSGGNYKSWISEVSEAAKGSQAQIGGGGGYYSGAYILGNCVVIGGIGGSGYTGGVTDGSMTTGTNSGNGYAIISFNAKEIGKTDFSCNINIPKKEGYTFDGYWTGKNGTGNEVIDNNGIVTTQPTYFHENPTANVNSDGEATLYANWTKDKYKFIYKANGGLTASKSDIITDNVSYNTSYHVRAVDGTFTREGYKLTGWKEKNTNGTWGKTWTANTNVNYNLTHSTTVYAQWQALDVNYTVNYYKENVNGSYTFVTSEKNRTAKSDSVISVAPTTNKEIFDSTGFTLNKDRTISAPAFESKASNGTVKVKINGNGSTVVNFYYSRNSYTLTLKTAANDKGFTSLLGAGDTCVKKIKYGDSVYIGAQLNKNYKFVAWKQTDGTVFSTTAAKRFTMPSNNLTLIAYSNSDATKPDGPPVTKKYTVKVQHYIQNSSGYTLYKTVNDSVEENTVYTPKQLSFTAGYHFYKAINSETQATVSRGFTVTGNVIVNVYYNRAKYQVVTDYYVDGALYKTLSEYAYYNDSYKVKGLSLTGYKIEKVDVPIYGSNPFTVKQNMTGKNKIKVYYVPSTYTITFSPNGGHITDGGKSVDTAKRTVKYNNTDNNNVSSLKPQRTGYTFIGWYTAIKGGTQIYNANGACNNDETHWKNNKWCGNSNLTVYAHWEANNQNLTFNANGGHINGNETIAVVTPTYDKNTFNNVEYLKPHKNGYIFKGWYTAKKDGTQIYSNLGLCKNDGTYWLNSKWHYTGDVTLYAQWTPITWTVKYAANGGKGTMANTTHTYGDASKTLSPCTFTRTGYTYSGYWYASRVRSGKTEWLYGDANGNFVDGNSWYEKDKNPNGTKRYKFPDKGTCSACTYINNDVITMHAQWTPNKYNLTLKYNGATTKPTGGASTIADDGSSATWNSFLTYDGKIPNVFGAGKIKKNGYIFTGWYCGDVKLWNADGTPVKNAVIKDKYWSDANVNYKWLGNTTVTAQWTPITWIVKYDANGGSGTMADTKHTYGSNEVRLRKNTFKKTGYNFVSWYASRVRDHKTEWLYGKNDGSYINGDSWYEKGKNPDGTKLYAFSDEHTCSTITYINNDVITMHAQWTPITWTVKYDANGGSGTMADTTHTYGDASKTLSPCTFVRTGYTYSGYWYASRVRNGKTEWLYGNADGKFVDGDLWYEQGKAPANARLYKFPDKSTCSVCTYIDKDVITMHAQWTAKKYNLTLIYNNATTIPTSGASFISEDGKSARWDSFFTYDHKINNIFGSNKIARKGYIFDGWYCGDVKLWNADGTPVKNAMINGKYWSDADGHYKWDGNTRVTAQWIPITWTVKYDANGGSGTMADSTFTFHDPNSVLRKNEFTRKGYEFKYWYMSRVRDGKTEWFYGNADGGWIGPESWYEKGKNPAGTKLYALTDGHTFNASTLINGDVIIAHAQWLGLKAKICYHSEDGKNDIVKEYQVGAGQKFEIATDWWRKQKFKTAYEPGNCIFAGWTTIKGSTDDMYRENETVPDSLIIEHINETIDIYSIWDKPTVGIAPTNNNISFSCNGKTWYTDTIEFVAMGNDQRYNVIGFDYMLGGDTVSANYRTTNSERGLMHSFSTSQYYSEGLRKVLNKGEPFTVKIWSESSTATSGTPMGTSDMSITQYWIDFTAPGLTYSVDSSRNIKVTATDDESGVNTIDLQSYRNGQWVSVNKATASSSQYSQFTNTFNLTQADYRYRYRVTATDHLGNSKTSGEFYVVPLTLKTALSKLDGTKVYNGQTLEFIAGGDLNATITANIGGYAETVKYEFSNELGQVVDSHTVSYAADGNATETKQFLIPWQLPHNQNYFVKVTAYRGNESVSTTEYVKLIDIDFSKFRSNIIYQSGQHN